jgi:hypothetical protein
VQQQQQPVDQQVAALQQQLAQEREDATAALRHVQDQARLSCARLELLAADLASALEAEQLKSLDSNAALEALVAERDAWESQRAQALAASAAEHAAWGLEREALEAERRQLRAQVEGLDARVAAEVLAATGEMQVGRGYSLVSPACTAKIRAMPALLH